MTTLCRSGRHASLSPEDAATCCTGWRRELRVGDTSGCDHVVKQDGMIYGYMWVREGPMGT
jgi:hypothetical protein